MRFARIVRAGGATMIGVAALSQPAAAQSRSATLRVSAQVIDVGALASMPFDPMEVTASTATAIALPSSRAFSVVPPRHSDVAVTMQVRGTAATEGRDLAIQLCRRSEGIGARCRRVPFGASLDGAQAGAVTDHAVYVRLLGLTDPGADTTRVTITLAYPGS